MPQFLSRRCLYPDKMYVKSIVERPYLILLFTIRGKNIHSLPIRYDIIYYVILEVLLNFFGVLGLISVQGHIPSSADPMWDYYFTVGPMVKRAVDLPFVFKALVPENKHKKLRLNEKVGTFRIQIQSLFAVVIPLKDIMSTINKILKVGKKR